MEWYKGLYLSEGLKNKRDKLIAQLEKNAGTRRISAIYIITLSSNEHNLFDIFQADFLMQPHLHGMCPMIVGLTNDYDEAVEIATSIIMDNYNLHHNFDILNYLKERVSDHDSISFHYPMEKLKKRHGFPFYKKNNKE